MTEKSKLYKKAGNLVGIEAQSKKQRGIIARRFMPRLEKFESAKFAEACPRIKLGNLKVCDGEREYFI